MKAQRQRNFIVCVCGVEEKEVEELDEKLGIVENECDVRLKVRGAVS